MCINFFSCFQDYLIFAYRKQFPGLIRLEDETIQEEVDDPISLSPMYVPISIAGSNPVHTFSEFIIRHLTRTSKEDPFDGSPLQSGWDIYADDIELKISDAEGHVVLVNGSE